MKTTIKTPQNYKPTKGELNTNPSKTMPGMDLSIKETVRRLSMGQPVPVAEDMIYDDIEELDEFIDRRISDITDLDDAKDFVDATLMKFKAVKKQIDAEKEKQSKEAEARRLAKQFYLEEMKKNSETPENESVKEN